MKINEVSMSKITVAIIVIACMLVLGACGKAPATTTTPTTTTPTTQPTTTTTTTTTQTTTTQPTTATPPPTITITAPTGTIPAPGNVTVTVQVTNFKVVEKQGQANVPGEGHIHYYLDVDAPTTQGAPAIPAGGTWSQAASTSLTFPNVSAGSHTISVQLVNNNHTPLNPPVVQKITINVQSVATTTTTTTATTTTPTGTPVTVNLVASGMAFDKSTITVPAGASVTINFENRDSVLHNLSVYNNSNAAPPAIFQGNTITSSTTIYKFTAPTTPGTYFFRCDVHPTTMTGSFIVQGTSSSGY